MATHTQIIIGYRGDTDVINYAYTRSPFFFLTARKLKSEVQERIPEMHSSTRTHCICVSVSVCRMRMLMLMLYDNFDRLEARCKDSYMHVCG